MSELQAQLTLIGVLVVMCGLGFAGVPMGTVLMIFTGLVLAYGLYVGWVKRDVLFFNKPEKRSRHNHD